MDDLQDQIRRLRDQVKGIGEVVIDADKEPLLSLMLSLDWGDDEMRDARGIFDQFDAQLRSSGVTYGFEPAMRERFMIDHHAVRKIIKSFLAADEYPRFCRTYAKTNPCSEFNGINDQ